MVSVSESFFFLTNHIHFYLYQKQLGVTNEGWNT